MAFLIFQVVMYISSIDDCYKVLKVSPALSYRKIRTHYQKEILKYHKFKNHNISYRNVFIAMVVAFDCLTYMQKNYRSGKRGTKGEIFRIWQENACPLAMDMANKYLQLKTQDFERIFYKGFTVVKRVVYFIFFIIAIYLVVVPVLVLQEDRSLLFIVLVILLVSVPLLKKLVDLLKAESRSAHRIKYIKKLREGLKYKGKNDSSFHDEDVVTQEEQIKLNQKNN